MRIALLLLAVCATFAVKAQDAPGLMRIVVPFAPGGSNDVIARALAPVLAKRLGNTVIVENKPGAAGVVGAEAVAKAPRDGSHLLLTSSTFLTAAATQPRVPFDALTAFAPVAMIAQGPLLLVVPAGAPFKSASEFLEAARTKPGALNYGTAGVGSVAHLATELLNANAGIRMTHVPYKGAANAVLDLAAGQINVMISGYSSIVPMLKSGKVRALAVTSAKPSPAFPDLPPLATTVPDYEIEVWAGVLATAGTPAALVQRLNREINEISAAPELKVLLDPDGSVPVAMDAAAFGARLRQELGLWKKIAAERQITVD